MTRLGFVVLNKKSKLGSLGFDFFLGEIGKMEVLKFGNKKRVFFIWMIV